jgi:hypothetical protein
LTRISAGARQPQPDGVFAAQWTRIIGLHRQAHEPLYRAATHVARPLQHLSNAYQRRLLQHCLASAPQGKNHDCPTHFVLYNNILIKNDLVSVSSGDKPKWK